MLTSLFTFKMYWVLSIPHHEPYLAFNWKSLIKNIHHLLNPNYSQLLEVLQGTSCTSQNKPDTPSFSILIRWKKLNLRENNLLKFMYLLRGWARIWLLICQRLKSKSMLFLLCYISSLRKLWHIGFTLWFSLKIPRFFLMWALPWNILH